MKTNALMIALLKHGLLVAFLAAGLTGCAHTLKYDANPYAEEGSLAAGKATIVVTLSDDAGYGSAWWQNVKVDGAKVGDLRNGAYVHANILPGEHEIEVGYPALLVPMIPLALQARYDAGKTYYFLWGSALYGQTVRYHLEPLMPARAHALINGKKDRTKS